MKNHELRLLLTICVAFTCWS